MEVVIQGATTCPIPPIRGGAIETVIYNMSQIFKKRNIKQHIITIQDMDIEEEMEEKICYHRIKRYFDNDNFVSDKMQIYIYSYLSARFIKNLLKENPDVKINIHQMYQTCIILNKIHNIKKPLILTMHNESGPLAKYAFKKNDILCVPSYFLKNRYSKLIENEIKVIYNATDTELFNPKFRSTGKTLLRDKYHIDPNQTLILFTGRLVKEKGILDYLKVAKKFVKSKNVRFLIMGTYNFGLSKPDKFFNETVSIIRKLENTNFLFDLPRKDFALICSACDICACPSVWEDPSPLVCYEAQSAGLPVIAYNSGGVPEIIEDGKTGIIIETNPEILYNAIIELINDETLRKSMGKKGRERAEELFIWKRYADEMIKLFEEV